MVEVKHAIDGIMSLFRGVLKKKSVQYLLTIKNHHQHCLSSTLISRVGNRTSLARGKD